MRRYLPPAQLSRINVEKSAYHQLSQFEIGGDNPCYQHLSELGHGLAERRRLRKGILIGFSNVANTLGISLVVAHGSLP
jgi:hypothetical protein